MMRFFSFLRRKQRKSDQSWRLDYRWLKVRAQVVTRDRGKCRICFSSRKLEVHHLDGAAWFPHKKFETDNLITLCRRHHHLYHRWNGGFRRKSTKESFRAFVQNMPSEMSVTLRLIALNWRSLVLILSFLVILAVLVAVRYLKG